MARNCVDAGIVGSFDLAGDATHHRRRLHCRNVADDVRDYWNCAVQIVDRHRFVVVHQTVVDFVGSFDFDNFVAGCMDDTDGNSVDSHDCCPRLSCQKRGNLQSHPHFLVALNSFCFAVFLCGILACRLFIRLHTHAELDYFGFNDNPKAIAVAVKHRTYSSTTLFSKRMLRMLFNRWRQVVEFWNFEFVCSVKIQIIWWLEAIFTTIAGGSFISIELYVVHANTRLNVHDWKQLHWFCCCCCCLFLMFILKCTFVTLIKKSLNGFN